MGLPQASSGLAHTFPNLLKWSDRSHLFEKISTAIQQRHPEWKIRVEQAVLVLFADEKLYGNKGPISVERVPDSQLKRRLECISPFCKHYMHHLRFENLTDPSWQHAAYKPHVQQPELTTEFIHEATLEEFLQVGYYECRFQTDPDLPTISEANAEEISKARSRDKGRCMVTNCSNTKHFWFIPFTWNNSSPHNNATGNLVSSSEDLADVGMLDSNLLGVKELGKTHKSWNIMCIDRVLCDFLQRGWGGFRFEEAGQPNDKGIVKVKLRFYWMPQMTGRFNREAANNNELMDIVNEFNAFVRAGCPPPPTYPKSDDFKVPKSGQLVVVERNAGDVESFRCAVKIHWACVMYTVLCGGAERPQFMTGKDQSYGHLEPRDEQFTHQKAELEEKDLVAQMAWKKYYQPSSDSGCGGSDPRTSGHGGGTSAG
ncbi:hypothetical protein FIE12Z_1844 [Fusarium flagelliforme]|uniref:HNH nuclease domain-containing protein n=1 Tax=Fusarium flagelliforme TaxID=2675880 RepID=A0A395N1H2_9HYPO|nr:hypothetical protein FIE12Z_1844 [Fusarium flagelliforme]